MGKKEKTSEAEIYYLDESDKKMLELMRNARNKDGSINWKLLENLIKQESSQTNSKKGRNQNRQ